MLEEILRDTYIYQHDLEQGRKEERERQLQARLQVQRKLLLTIVQAHFPKLTDIAKIQAEHIEDVAVLEEVTNRVGAARTMKEARNALQMRN